MLRQHGAYYCIAPTASPGKGAESQWKRLCSSQLITELLPPIGNSRHIELDWLFVWPRHFNLPLVCELTWASCSAPLGVLQREHLQKVRQASLCECMCVRTCVCCMSMCRSVCVQWLYALPHEILVRRPTGALQPAIVLLACHWFKCTDCKSSAFLDLHRWCWAQSKYIHAGKYYHLLQLSRIGSLYVWEYTPELGQKTKQKRQRKTNKYNGKMALPSIM